MTTVVVILVLCILFEALFSGSELALLSADKVRLRHIAEEEGSGHRGEVIQRFLDDPGELITASLIGTNICVVLSTVITTLTLLQWYPRQAELLSLAVMTPLVLIFGEILPKSIFQTYADKLAPAAIYALWIWRLLVFPIVAAGSAFSRALLRLLSLEREQRAVMSREELGLLLRLPSREGEDRITPQEKEMVARIFEIKETTAETVMLHLSEVTAVPVSASVEEVAQAIADKQHTRIPVYEERIDQIVGIVHAYEVLRAGPGDALKVLSRPPIFVPENQPALDTLVRMQREGQGMAVVVDEFGGATGVITIEDILEEIVGEIEDEYDSAESEVVFREPDGNWRVLGRAEVHRVNALLKLNLPEDDEDYESIAGLMLDRLKRIPVEGEQLTIGKVTLTVTRASERAVEEVRIRIRR